MSKVHQPKESFASIDAERTNTTPAQNANGAEASANTFDLASLRVTDDLEFPLEIDICSEIQNILAAGVFRNLENPVLYEKLCDMMLSERYHNLIEALFWVIFVVKFQKDELELLEKLRKRLGRHYSEYFSLLVQPKEELSNMGIIGSAYVCHILFFNLFPKERDHFDMRFILDCYHIVIHEVNGIFVSDFYIQTSIERIFGHKFFHYEKRAERKKKVDKIDFRDEPLLRDLNYDLKHLPQVSGGLDLAQELSMKLRKAPAKRFKTANTNDLNESNANNRSNIPGNRAIMRLTQPQEERSMLSNQTEMKAYFPKLKFNCHQISPTVSSFLDNTNNSLPFQKRKVINYSNNKHVSDSLQFSYQSALDGGNDFKSDKKDKKKNQEKGTISDYQLKNRPEDYYLGYMPQTMKKKFKSALDMKYIFDHLRPTLRVSNSVRHISDDLSKKHQYILPRTQPTHETIHEDEEEDKKDIALFQNLDKDEPNMPESPLEKDKNVSFEKKLKLLEEGGNESILPSIKKTYTRTLSNGDKSPLRRGSMLRKDLLPKIDDNTDRTFEGQKSTATEKLEVKKSVVPGILKFQAAANKKLGKGRFFVSLEDHDEDNEEKELKKKFPKKYAYEDKRKHYYAEHDAHIRKDVDANIEHLVNRLITKQSMFNRNFTKTSSKNG